MDTFFVFVKLETQIIIRLNNKLIDWFCYKSNNEDDVWWGSTIVGQARNRFPKLSGLSKRIYHFINPIFSQPFLPFQGFCEMHFYLPIV